MQQSSTHKRPNTLEFILIISFVPILQNKGKAYLKSPFP